MLRHFAETLLSHVRDSDCVGRLGGDEFGVLLTHADQEQALKKADVLAGALRASSAHMERGKYSCQLFLWRL